MQDATFYGTQVFLPLLLDMDQCPLPAAEGKMLQAGDGEQIVVTVHRQIIR
jgi:hypothetical protein